MSVSTEGTSSWAGKDPLARLNAGLAVGACSGLLANVNHIVWLRLLGWWAAARFNLGDSPGPGRGLHGDDELLAGSEYREPVLGSTKPANLF